jgi:putative membrane protein
MTTPPRKPTAISLAEAGLEGDGPTALGTGGMLLRLEPEPGPADADAAEIDSSSLAAIATTPRRSRLATVFWAALGGLVSLGFGLAVTSLIEDLFARFAWLGWVGLALAALLLGAALLLLGREALALRRLGRIDALRVRATDALALDDRAVARGVVAELMTLYASEPRTARARAELERSARDIIDGADLVRLAEAELMAPLDQEAKRLVGRAAQRVSVITAIAPRAVIDIAVVATVAVSLIRGVATVYGARPGTLGFLRLLRHVLAHLAVTGGMAAGESMLDQLVGHGLAARLSARLGEGVINGVLTARVGLAAIAVCRPLPFAARSAPTLREVAGGLLQRGKGAG